MAASNANPPSSGITFAVQTSIGGARGALKVGEQLLAPSEQNARARAEKLSRENQCR